MSHALDDPIPGETTGEMSTQDGMSWLWNSLETFRDQKGPLRPHFAYGPLPKAKFARAHLMHIEDHLRKVRAI